MPRKTRTDPAQEALLQKKDKANANTTALISLLIDLKRAWNGYPAPDIGINERSSIKFPLPDQINDAQNRIKTLFDDVLNQIDDIQNSQASYSRTRRLSRKELGQNPQSSPPETTQVDKGWNDLAPPENAPGLVAFHQFNLKKEATTSFSRLMAHVIQAFDFKDKNRWDRLRMLRSSADILDLLEEVEDSVLSQKPDSIPNSFHNLMAALLIINNSFIQNTQQTLDSSIKSVDDEIQKLNKQKEKKPEDKTQEKPKNEKKPAEKYEEVSEEDIIEDPEFLSNPEITEITQETNPDLTEAAAEAKKTLDASLDFLTKLEPHIYSYNDEHLKESLDNIRNLILSSNMLLESNPIKALINSKKIIADLSSLSMIVFQNPQRNTTSQLDYELYSYASNRFTRWFKRYWLEVVGGKDKNLRIDISNQLKSSHEELRKVMDLLEKRQADMSEVIENINKFLVKIKPAALKLIELGEIHNSLAKIERGQKRLKGERFRLDLISDQDKRKLFQEMKSIDNSFTNKVSILEKKTEELNKLLGDRFV